MRVGDGGDTGAYVLGRFAAQCGDRQNSRIAPFNARDADFSLYSVFFRYFWLDPFSADPFPVFRFFPQLLRLSKVYVNILYFLLFHLSLSELSVSFCVHFL